MPPPAVQEAGKHVTTSRGSCPSNLGGFLKVWMDLEPLSSKCVHDSDTALKASSKLKEPVPRPEPQHTHTL
jgi:hypothetical protein